MMEQMVGALGNPGRLEEAETRVAELASRVCDVRLKLLALDERLFGPLPPCPPLETEGPEASGSLPRLLQAIDGLGVSVNDLANQAQLLEDKFL